mgnify:CR=1 FL=1
MKKVSALSVVIQHILWFVAVAAILLGINYGYQIVIGNENANLPGYILPSFVPLANALLSGITAVAASFVYLKMAARIQRDKQKLSCILSGICLIAIVILYNIFYYLFVSFAAVGLPSSYALATTGLINIALGINIPSGRDAA